MYIIFCIRNTKYTKDEMKYYIKRLNKLEIAILIPTLNPSDSLIILMENLIHVGFKDIIIVNDGSHKKYNHIFQRLAELPECHILTHAINLGKGRALKTGFNFFLNNLSNYLGIITVDADGQHKVEDVLKVEKELKKQPRALVLGVRNFNQSGVPLKNKLGNKITRFVFSVLINIKVQDTQTGLRGISTGFIENLLKVTGECFEYETNMLLETKKEQIPISEVLIETVYLNNNASSHFNPLLDSIKIYALIFKFTSVSLVSFLIDISIFNIFIRFLFSKSYTYALLLSTVMARVVSSIFNYKCNKTFVFDFSQGRTLLKYFFLTLIQMILSGLLLEAIYRFTKGSATLLKIIIDLFLFIASFKIQRDYIFSKPEVQ